MAILEQSWSTAHLLPGKALSYWRDVICENLLQMHIQSSQGSGFFGSIEKHAFGPMKANFISVSEQKVWRERTAACNERRRCACESQPEVVVDRIKRCFHALAVGTDSRRVPVELSHERLLRACEPH